MFSRSKTKRFNDPVSCAPPPGHYNLPDVKKVQLASFQKGDRWTAPKETPQLTNSSCESLTQSTNVSVNKSFAPNIHSSVKKKAKATKNVKEFDIADSCRKSLEADVEFQQSKVNALLEKIRSLELQVKGSSSHSLDIEKSNEKLHEIISDLRKEKSCLLSQIQELEEKLNVLQDEKETLVKESKEQILKLKEFEDQFNNERSELLKKLEVSEELNVDFREQLESIESVMTENLRGLSEKYESLEQTLDNVQTDYRKKLERSNSLVEKVKEAHQISKHDLETMQNVYNELKEDYNGYKIEVLQSTGRYEEEEKKLREQIIEMEKKIEGTTAEKREMELSAQEKDTENAMLNTKLLELGEEITQYKNKIGLQNDENENLLQQYDEMKKCFEASENVNVKLKETVERLELESEELTNRNEDLSVTYNQQVKELERQTLELKDTNQALCEQNRKLQDALNNKRDESIRYQGDIAKSQVIIKRLEDAIVSKEETLKATNEKFQRNLEMLQKELQTTKQELELFHENPNKMIDANIAELEEELERSKSKYYDLESKVGPFMSQLEQFEFEKQALMNENAFTQSEMSKLSERYARILGHQNNKQKIHHIRKLKEENLTLKSEVLKLRGDVTREKKKINERDEHGKKFDRPKATKLEGKENKAAKEPLKQRNGSK